MVETRRKTRNAGKPVEGTQSIARAIRVLREFATADARGLRVIDICERLELEWPTVHRILLCLQREQMLVPAEDTKRYRLGPAVFQLGLAAAPQFSLRETCREALDRLVHATGDTLFLTARSATHSVVIERREGTFPVKALTLEVGVWRPLGVGAGGLAILAGLPDEEARDITHVNAPRLSSCSDLTADALLALTRESRARGFAIDAGHAFPEVTGVGVAIRAPSGAPIAAISISAIKSRMTNERIKQGLKLLRREIAEIESHMSASSS